MGEQGLPNPSCRTDGGWPDPAVAVQLEGEWEGQAGELFREGDPWEMVWEQNLVLA